MELRRLLSTLAQQIEVTRNASETEQAHAGLLRALFHSFRVTYLALSTGLDPRRDASHLFTLHVTDAGLPLLMQGGQPVPVNAPFLAELFGTAGVEPLPGQTLLLEAEIAKAAVEEALGGVALEQALADRDRAQQRDPDALAALEMKRNLLWDRKSDLIAASLVADEYLERATADPEQEAA
jgi:hypothetical protein